MDSVTDRPNVSEANKERGFLAKINGDICWVTFLRRFRDLGSFPLCPHHLPEPQSPLLSARKRSRGGPGRFSASGLGLGVTPVTSSPGHRRELVTAETPYGKPLATAPWASTHLLPRQAQTKPKNNLVEPDSYGTLGSGGGLSVQCKVVLGFKRKVLGRLGGSGG